MRAILEILLPGCPLSAQDRLEMARKRLPRTGLSGPGVF